MSDTALPPVIKKETKSTDEQLLQAFEIYKNDFISFGTASLHKSDTTVDKLVNIEKVLIDASRESMTRADDLNNGMLNQLTTLNQNVLDQFNFQKDAYKKEEELQKKRQELEEKFREKELLERVGEKGKEALFDEGSQQNLKGYATQAALGPLAMLLDPLNQAFDTNLLQKPLDLIKEKEDKALEKEEAFLGLQIERLETEKDLQFQQQELLLKQMLLTSQDSDAMTVVPTKNSVKKTDPGAYYIAETISSDLTSLIEQNDENQEKLIELQEDEADASRGKGKKSLTGIMALAMPALALIMSLVSSGVLPKAIEHFKEGLKNLPITIFKGIKGLFDKLFDWMGQTLENAMVGLGEKYPLLGKILGTDPSGAQKDYDKALSEFSENRQRIENKLNSAKQSHDEEIARLEKRLEEKDFKFFENEEKLQKKINKLKSEREEKFSKLEAKANKQNQALIEGVEKRKSLLEKVSKKQIADPNINLLPIVNSLKSTSVNDAIITKDGQIIHTDEDDNLIATKNDIRMSDFDENSTNTLAQSSYANNQEMINLLKLNNDLLEKLTIVLEANDKQPVISNVNNANVGAGVDFDAIRNMTRKDR
jgi:hypothetical protein